MKEFMYLYNMGRWMLPKTNIERIEAALMNRGMRPRPKESQLTIETALDMIPGSKIIE